MPHQAAECIKIAHPPITATTNFEAAMNDRRLTIRNSTAEFLIFTRQAGEDGIEVRYQDESVWLTQKLMAALFDVDRSVITKHLKNIFQNNELEMDSVCAIFAHTAADGKTYHPQFYNLDAIISVGYRVNSRRARPHV